MDRNDRVIDVREVTAEEVAQFAEHGWVFLPRLIAPEQARRLLERAKGLMGADGTGHVLRPGVDMNLDWWHDYASPSHDDDLFAELARSPTTGRNAALLLLGREVPIRLLEDELAVKLPAASSERGEETEFHQDSHGPIDRNRLAFWIALDEITPAQGSMRFINGSFKLGPLGDMAGRGLRRSAEEVGQLFPRLASMPLSEPRHFEPGDATVHLWLTMHTASANTTDRPRWVHRSTYFPADAQYTGATSVFTADHGLVPGKELDHPDFPVIYSP